MSSSGEYDNELLRVVLRVTAMLMLCMGVFTLVSGGISFISSILVIGMASQWLRAVASRGSLAQHLQDLSQLESVDCRGCCSSCCTCKCRGVLDNVRGLAIAAIVLASLELVTIFFILIVWRGLVSYGRDDFPSFNPSYCRTSSTGPCPYQYCYDYPAYDPYNNIAYYLDTPVEIWLKYALGNTVVSASLNIAWGVFTLKLIAALKHDSSPVGESTALLAQVAKPKFATLAHAPEVAPPALQSQVSKPKLVFFAAKHEDGSDLRPVEVGAEQM